MKMIIEKDKNLAGYTTFKIGGIAKFFAKVTSVKEALEAIEFAKKEKLPVFVLGGGSNILMSDDGFEGLVIKNEIKAFKLKQNFVIAGAGESWDEVVTKAIDVGLEGIECLSAVPGTFGGAVVQNIGAYGQTLSNVVDEVEVIDIATGKLLVFPNADCEFEYRSSIFKTHPGKFLITAAVLKLTEINRGNISYHALKEYFVGKPSPTITRVREAVIYLRAAKGMVIMPEYDSYKSAGSYFKNPVVSKELFERLKSRIHCPDPWYWTYKQGIKVSAACLVSSSGFKKGEILKNAQISPKQSLAIINPGEATAKDIVNLATTIKSKVFEKFGIALEEEVVYVGKLN